MTGSYLNSYPIFGRELNDTFKGSAMAERMSTARRMDRNRVLGRITRAKNSIRKRKERNNRDKRMAALIQKSTFPYTPAVMSWLSVKLGKPASQITPDDVKTAVS